MRPIFVLDACSLIAFFNDEAGADVVEKLLVKAWQNDIELIISIINLLEIYYGIYREDGSDMADRTLQKIK
ncbi:MAG: VapC toxin family PIN domain ribonuclease, partial [Desulfobacteraceae bacterium IS3]